MFTLHYFPGNASMAPHIVLEELGLPYQLQWVDRGAGAHQRPEYLALNPNGLIPVLVQADPTQPAAAPLVLYEAAAICLHLADHAAVADAPAPVGADGAARPRLLPPLGSAERAHAYKWLTWLTNTVQATLIHYFYPERLVDDGDAAAAAQVRRRAEAKVGALLDQLDAQLARHGQDWVLGEACSVVDAYAFMLCRWTRGFGRPARSLPHLGPYLQRMSARPAVQRVFAQEAIEGAWV